MRRIVIIGAGYVGLEAAFNLYKKGKEVTIIEKSPKVLQGQLDDKATMIIQNGIEEEGIRLILNANAVKIAKPIYSGLAKIFGQSTSNVIVLEDGRRIKADMIIAAAGSRPNLSFISNSTMLNRNKGIIVDRHMKTSVDNVYAAGDVVESIDAVTGKSALSPIWPNAVIQGEYAAYNMAGVEKEVVDLISMQNASEFREIPMIAMGITDPQSAEYEEYADYRPNEKIYRKIVIKDDIIVGVVFLGDIKNAGVIGSLMKNKVNIRRVKDNMLNPNFGYSEVADMV